MATTNPPVLQEQPANPPAQESVQKNVRTGPATRRSDQLKQARAALFQWRSKIKLERYSPSPYTSAVILPDPILTTLASNARIQTLQDMSNTLGECWIFLDRHGDEVLKLLQAADATFYQHAEREREEKKNAKKAAKAAVSSAGTPASAPLIGSSVFNVSLISGALRLY